MRILEAGNSTASTVTRPGGGSLCGQDNLNVDLDSEYPSRSNFVAVIVYCPSATNLSRSHSKHCFSFFPTYFTKFKHADAECSGHVLLIEKEGKGFAHSEDTSTLGAFQMKRDQVRSDLCKQNQGIKGTSIFNSTF